MCPHGEKSFPNWDSFYKNQEVQTMPWFFEKLDTDLELELEKRKIAEGRILDLGTGPATQAVQLSRRGLRATGSDISRAAIARATKIYSGSDKKNLKFIVDDILNSKINDNEFDYVFDRGCFHVMPIKSRPRYISEIKRILCKSGILFLKCFSTKEQREEGPYKFSDTQLRELFGGNFVTVSIKDTVYQGTLDPLPKALFAVMKRL